MEIVCNCYVITKLLLFVIVLVTYLRQIIAPCFKKPGLFYREVEALGSEKSRERAFTNYVAVSGEEVGSIMIKTEVENSP